MNAALWVKNIRFGLFYQLFTRRISGLKTLGQECQWTLRDRGFGPESKILCAGAGHDISFEKALIADYGCRVVLLDPSPTGIATVARERLPEDQLAFFPIGLAGVDGALEFQEPHDPNEGSFVGCAGGGARVLSFSCKTLPTMMNKLGWNHLDLLKIDIEGFEYAVLRNILEQPFLVKQICVEFHHGPQYGRPNSDTVRMILALRKAGYDLVHRVYQDHTFLLREA